MRRVKIANLAKKDMNITKLVDMAIGHHDN